MFGSVAHTRHCDHHRRWQSSRRRPGGAEAEKASGRGRRRRIRSRSPGAGAGAGALAEEEAGGSGEAEAEARHYRGRESREDTQGWEERDSRREALSQERSRAHRSAAWLAELGGVKDSIEICFDKMGEMFSRRKR